MSAVRTPARYAATILALVTLAGSAGRAQTSLTIYNDGRVLVRRTVPVRVPGGASTQTVALGLADPSTLFSLDPAVNVVRASYDGAVDEASVLRRAVGRRIVFRTPRTRPDGTAAADTVSAVVLSADPLQLQMPDGRVSFTMPGQPLYPADLVVSVPSVALTLQSAGARDNLRLGYFTQGARWQASYQVVLGGNGAAGDARVGGAAVVTSETLKADSADVQLLAGSVNAAAPAPQYAVRGQVAAMAMAKDEAMQVSEQRVGEFHLYSVPEKLTLLPGQTTSAAMFDPATVRYERNYVVHGQLPIWGYLPQQPNEEEVPVEVSYTLKRPRKTDFGDRPLPGGVARLFQADSAGRLQLIGEAGTGHTPAGEDLRLIAGNAFDLTAKRVQTSYTTRRDSVVAGVWRTTATADYRVTISNATDSTATVDVLEERRGEWTVVSSSVKPEKVSSSVTRFRITVPARGDAVLTYRVRVTW
ncbi:MAG: DUF4139 domain-containing protein [Bacillota bacterium]